MKNSTTEDTEGTEQWRDLALEVRESVLEHWSHENEPKSEHRLLRVVRALDAIQALRDKEGLQ